MAKLKYWDGSQWITTDSENSDKLGGQPPSYYGTQAELDEKIERAYEEGTIEPFQITDADKLGGHSPDYFAPMGDIEGKIIEESGSNDDGRFIKFADGTLICYNMEIERTTDRLVGPVYRSGLAVAYLPIPFTLNNYTCFGSAISSTAQANVYRHSLNDRVSVILHSGENGDSATINLSAIGRWK